MKKYLKMAVFVIIYIVLPLLLNLLVISAVQNIGPIARMRNVTPTSIFMITDPVSVIALFLVTRFIRKEKPFKFANVAKISPLNALICAGAGLVLAAVTFSLMNLPYMKDDMVQIGYTINWIISGNVFVLIVTALVNNAYKEFCFRGLAMNEMRRLMPAVIALFIQAMFYAGEILYFQNPFSTVIYAFLGQVVFGLVFILGKSFFSSFIAQMGCTIGLIIIDRTALKGIFTAQSSLILLVLSVLGTVALVWLLNGTVKKKATSIGNADKSAA